jgi:murein DD-endopeptidase MepM/ murein hydrolase activator NlpD
MNKKNIKLITLIIFITINCENILARSLDYSLKKVTEELGQLNTEISRYHYQFIFNAKKIEDVQVKINKLRIENNKNQELIKKENQNLEKLITLNLLNNLYEMESEQVFLKEVIIQDLKKKLQTLKIYEEKSKTINSIIKDLASKLEVLESYEKKLGDFLNDIKVQRKQLQNQKFLSKTNIVELPRQKEKFQIKGHLLDNYLNHEGSTKGLTYYYKGANNIKSPSKGVIVHSGKLSSLGNVLVIDHGGGLRSVILGEFIGHVKKDDLVEENQVLGVTTSAPGQNVSSLYFEIRKEDQPLNVMNFFKTKI